MHYIRCIWGLILKGTIPRGPHHFPYETAKQNKWVLSKSNTKATFSWGDCLDFGDFNYLFLLMLVGFSRSQILRACNHIVTIQVQQRGFTSVESLKAGGFTIIRATVPKNNWLSPHLSLIFNQTQNRNFWNTSHLDQPKRKLSNQPFLSVKISKSLRKSRKRFTNFYSAILQGGCFQGGRRSPIFLIVSLSSQRFLVRNPKFHSYPFPLNPLP